MFKTDYTIRSYSSAHSGRVERVVLAPPFLIFAVFGIMLLTQVPAMYLTRNVSLPFGASLLQIGMMLFAPLLVIRVFRLTKREVIPLVRPEKLQAVLSLFIMFSVAILADYFLAASEYILPVKKPLDEVYREILRVDGLGSYLYKAIFFCFMPSFCEEVFFRGFCQTGLVRSYGTKLGILMTAAMFALCHLNFWYFHVYLILGIALGWLAVASRSLWIPIICHLLNNVWTFTSYTVHLRLPLSGMFWPNAAIVAAATIVLLFAVAVWYAAGKLRNSSASPTPAPCKTPSPRSRTHP